MPACSHARTWATQVDSALQESHSPLLWMRSHGQLHAYIVCAPAHLQHRQRQMPRRPTGGTTQPHATDCKRRPGELRQGARHRQPRVGLKHRRPSTLSTTALNISNSRCLSCNSQAGQVVGRLLGAPQAASGIQVVGGLEQLQRYLRRHGELWNRLAGSARPSSPT